MDMAYERLLMAHFMLEEQFADSPPKKKRKNSPLYSHSDSASMWK